MHFVSAVAAISMRQRTSLRHRISTSKNFTEQYWYSETHRGLISLLQLPTALARSTATANSSSYIYPYYRLSNTGKEYIRLEAGAGLTKPGPLEELPCCS